MAKTCPHEAALSRKAVERTIHVYNRKVDETKPVTNQKSTGRFVTCIYYTSLADLYG